LSEVVKTELRHLSEAPVVSGLPASIPSPVKSELFAGKHEARLGTAVGLTQFGVNHLTLEPGAASAFRHWHEGEDEFVFVLSGELVLIDDNGEHMLIAGSFAGFPAGRANAHHLVNRSSAPASFLAAGTRKVGVETIHYPDDAELGVRTVTRDSSGRRI
jgi:uncharacterized cupin superfamily protein